MRAACAPRALGRVRDHARRERLAEVDLRVRGGLAGDARPARRQGGQRRGDDAAAGGRQGPRRLHDHHRGLCGLHAGRRDTGGPRRPAGRRAVRLGGTGGQEAGRPRGPAAGLRALRGARVDAGDARHRPEPRAQRRVGARPRRPHGEPALRLGLLPAVRADVLKRRQGRARGAHRGGDRDRQAGARRRRRHAARRRRAAGARRDVQGAVPRGDGGGVPAGPARAARRGHPRGLRLLDGRPRGDLPAAESHPGFVGHGGQRAADGLRQQGR